MSTGIVEKVTKLSEMKSRFITNLENNPTKPVVLDAEVEKQQEQTESINFKAMGKGVVNAPSTTGRPSGGGRGNNPSK